MVCKVGQDREPSSIRQDNERTSIGTHTSAAGPLRTNDLLVHRNGVELQIQTIKFGANGTWVEFEVTNPRTTGIRINGCCNVTYLIDDRGTTYPLQALQGDPTVLIDGEATIGGTLFFDGKVSTNAEPIELLFGDTDNGSQADPDAAWPKFIFGPYFIER